MVSEDREVFEGIVLSLIEEYQPKIATERMLVEQISVAWLRLYRLWNLEAASFNETLLETEKKISYPDTIKAARDLLGKVGLPSKGKEALATIEVGINNAKIAASLPDTERLLQLNRYERHIMRYLWESLDRLIVLRQ